VTGAAGTLSWVHGNHLGVPIVTTDSAGNLAAPTGYTPVGFPGQTKALADLYYNRYRDYDPTSGRYIQADPIGLGGGANPYLYAGGNPLNAIDPMGLETLWEHYTGLPDQYRVNAINVIAGWQDALTFGLANDFRNSVGLNKDVNRCSTAYGVGEVAGVATGIVVGGVAGIEASGTKGAGMEFSHWIPNRAGGPRSIWNGNYVTSARHYYHDPFRYPAGWRDLGPKWPAPIQQFDRVPNVYKGAAAGAGLGIAGTASCTCGS
jgi:RHS repeat-associated protein